MLARLQSALLTAAAVLLALFGAYAAGNRAARRAAELKQARSRVALLVAGCAASSSNYCDIAKPIWWDNAEELDATPTPIVRQIVEHNETVRMVCQFGTQSQTS